MTKRKEVKGATAANGLPASVDADGRVTGAPAVPLTGWRVGDAGFTVFGPKTDAPAPRIILQGKDRAAVRLAAAAPDLLAALRVTLGTLTLTDADGDETKDGRTVGDVLRAAIARAEGK